jgi:hypothetical protein
MGGVRSCTNTDTHTERGEHVVCCAVAYFSLRSLRRRAEM